MYYGQPQVVKKYVFIAIFHDRFSHDLFRLPTGVAPVFGSYQTAQDEIDRLGLDDRHSPVEVRALHGSQLHGELQAAKQLANQAA